MTDAVRACIDRRQAAAVGPRNRIDVAQSNALALTVHARDTVTAPDQATLAGATVAQADQRREEEIQRCRDRYVWLVDHIDEVVLPLTAGLLTRITNTAVRLEDCDLVAFSR